MNTSGISSRAGAFVLVLLSASCTYEMPTIDASVGGQGGSGGASTSSSGTPPGTSEDCLDGTDNDEDGAIDCADTDCKEGFTCTEVFPEGWTQVILEQGSGVPSTAPCASGDSPEVLFKDPAGPAECEACACGNLEGASCTLPGLTCFPYSLFCAINATDLTNIVTSSECTKPDLANAETVACRLSEPAAVDQVGGCKASIADFSNKESFSGWVRACPFKTTSGGGGCAAGACMATPAAGSTCIRKDGSESCPVGWDRIEAYVGAKDERGCAECTCTPLVECMGGGYRFYDFDDCQAGGDPPIEIKSKMCTNVSGLPDFTTWSIEQIPPKLAGSCMPQGGEPTGSVMPQDPVTFCCK